MLHTRGIRLRGDVNRPSGPPRSVRPHWGKAHDSRDRFVPGGTARYKYWGPPCNLVAAKILIADTRCPDTGYGSRDMCNRLSMPCTVNGTTFGSGMHRCPVRHRPFFPPMIPVSQT